MPRLISDYLDLLTLELSFDPALARRLREEVEDHLRESVAADPAGTTAEAECRAISRFGAVRDIARRWAAPSLARQTTINAAAAITIVIAVLIAMKSRIAWYGGASGMIDADPQLVGVSSIIASIDRYASWLALGGAIGGAALVGFARLTGTPNAAWRQRLRRSLLLCAVATVAIVVTVTSDMALTLLRLLPAGWAAAFCFPSLTIGIEAALAVVLAVRTRRTIRRLGSSATLFTA
jgi:hypothetical protein